MAGGESRHWIQDVTSPTKENEDIYGREHDIPSLYRSDVIRGGFSVNENISGGNDTVQREEKYRGGFSKAIYQHRPYILESFFYADEDTERLLPYFGDFMLDSGAFTFMQNTKTHVDWDDYIKKYADFIVRNNIKKYFELDIDSVVGYKQVLKYRSKLEELTGRRCIPVWHKSRGIAEYYKHCTEYPYVGIGGYVVKELTPKEYKAFPQMIRYAHKNGAKVHCLGFTRLRDLPKYHFDSVDSTAWTAGNKFGFVYRFNGETMVKHNVPQGMRLADSKRVALKNYTEWIKFQQYAERCL